MPTVKFNTALIVGAGSGLSAALARVLATEGIKVALAARSTGDLGGLAKEIGASTHSCDASKRADVEKLFADLDGGFGAPEIVIYNPSYRTRGAFTELDPAEVEKTLMVSAFGGFLVGQQAVKRMLPTKVIFLEASESILLRRFSETRRPHPLGADTPVKSSLAAERRHLRYIRAMADLVIDTSRFNVHELRAYITQRFHKKESGKNILVSCVSFGFKHGVPDDADLLFDVRFLPNPHFVPEFRPLTGRNPKVAKYIRSFPQSREFIQRISKLLVYLLPHYIREGKSYLTISFGCTGGQHRSVMIAEDVGKRLRKAGYRVKVVHRDSPG